MAELADALGLEPSAERHESSSLSARTKFFAEKRKEKNMTQVKIKNLSDTKRKISVKVPKDAIPTYLKKAYQKVGAKAKIPGFRAGKIPDQVLDRHYAGEIDYECLNFMVDETYRQALQDNKIIPLLNPKFDVGPVKRDADYEYHVELEVKPEFTLKPYKELKLKNRTPKVEASEVENELTALRERMAESEPAEANAVLADGFVATIDFEGKLDGTAFAGGTAKDYVLNFGKGSFIKSFEEQIAGAKVGEARDIKVEFPKDYFEKSLAGKTADFHVIIKALHKKKLPVLDDEFAKDVGKASLQELKDDIQKHISLAKAQAVRPEYVKEIREQFLKTYKFQIPEGLVEHQLQQLCKDHDHGDHKDHKHPGPDEIEQEIRFEFVLEAIALAENVRPTPEEVHRHLSYYAQMYRKPLAEIQQAFAQNGMMPNILSRIVLDKTLDLIVENAKLV